MNLLIDATNITGGGGLSHLQELLEHVNYEIINENEIKKIFIIGSQKALDKIGNKFFIEKISMNNSDESSLKRILWKLQNLNSLIKRNNIDFVFNPGGAYISRKYKYVTMCRNMLVFDKKEARRFGILTPMRLKFYLLEIIQSLSMKYSDGVIFISKYAHDYVTTISKISIKNSITINHGVSVRFSNDVKFQSEILSYSKGKPFKILYVSRLDVYKHHYVVAKAIINIIQKKNYPIEFIVVGEKIRDYKRFEALENKYPNLIKYFGEVDFNEMQNIYKNADLFVFASSCENMPNILIEAMSAGLPIICSKMEPMSEFLKDGGIYFNPESIYSAEQALIKMIESPSVRTEKANKAKLYSSNYSWDECAKKTFAFINLSYKLHQK